MKPYLKLAVFCRVGYHLHISEKERNNIIKENGSSEAYPKACWLTIFQILFGEDLYRILCIKYRTKSLSY